MTHARDAHRYRLGCGVCRVVRHRVRCALAPTRTPHRQRTDRILWRSRSVVPCTGRAICSSAIRPSRFGDGPHRVGFGSGRAGSDEDHRSRRRALYYPNVITDLPVGRFYLLGTREADGRPLSILEGYDVLNHMIGENWFSRSSTAQVVNYSASIGLLSGSLSAPGTDDGAEMGRRSLDDQIKNAAEGGNPVVIAGLSEGTIVINRELAYLATDPEAPPADSLSFVLFSSPELGLANTYWPDGLTVPLINYTPQSVTDSQYDVSVVFSRYDAWADPPDRPWNLVAVVNSLFGTAYFHNTAAMAVPSDAVEVSSVTGELKGTTTTYMVPSPTVPMLKPLQQLGVPTQIVDTLNSRLKPIVDAGYSRLTPEAGPHFSHG